MGINSHVPRVFETSHVAVVALVMKQICPPVILTEACLACVVTSRGSNDNGGVCDVKQYHKCDWRSESHVTVQVKLENVERFPGKESFSDEDFKCVQNYL